MQEELPEGKNKAIIHNNAGYVAFHFALPDLSYGCTEKQTAL